MITPLVNRHLAVVRSGAQTGVDIAALRAAKALGIPTAGTMPLGWRTHNGPRPEYREDYGCDEHTSPEWAPRTRANVEAADVTLALAEHPNSPGERCTVKACADLRKPCYRVTMVRRDGALLPVDHEVDDAVTALRRLAVVRGKPIALNVAGNSERTASGIEAAAEPVLRAMLARVAAPLAVWTARIDCGDADALDITAKSGGPLGKVFAPSWEILRPALDARATATAARKAGHHEEAELVEAAAWERYVPAYTAEMQRSYVAHRAAWREVLSRERIVGTCYCAAVEGGAPLRCHRRLWAGLLVKCGATDMGELPRVIRRKGARTG